MTHSRLQDSAPACPTANSGQRRRSSARQDKRDRSSSRSQPASPRSNRPAPYSPTSTTSGPHSGPSPNPPVHRPHRLAPARDTARSCLDAQHLRMTRSPRPPAHRECPRTHGDTHDRSRRRRHESRHSEARRTTHSTWHGDAYLRAQDGIPARRVIVSGVSREGVIEDGDRVVIETAHVDQGCESG